MAKDFYHERLSTLAEQRKKEKKQDLRYSGLRFISLIVALLLFYLTIKTGENLYLPAAFIMVAVFLFLLRKHQDLRATVSRTKALQKLNEAELKAIDGDFSHFDDGYEFLTAEHFYAHDLDVIGNHSLFQYLNRTATIGGKTLLAKWLLGEETVKVVSDQQKQVKALSKQSIFRQRFSVEGDLIEEEPRLLERFERWLKDRLQLNILANPFVLYLFAAIGIGFFGLWIYQPTLDHFKWFSYAFGLNLALTFSQYRYIQKAYYQLGNMAKTLGMYANFIALIEQLPADEKVLSELKDALKGEDKEASQSLRKLKRILDRFDQLNNVVALVLTNGLYHNHVHALHALEKWKKEHISDLPQWLAMVHKVDALNSLANYAFNNPENAYPSQQTKPSMTLVNAAHPLIMKHIRVGNSISFSDVPYYILTGSNMSGKSTFLKTIGLNLILAKAGAPVAAEQMEFYPFKLLSSMKLVDSISRAESYFQAEVLKLKRIKEELDKGEACFVLLDEILRGTNSDDKRKGTRLFMEKLKGYNAMGVLATHDIDVAELADSFPEAYTTAFFESRVAANELIFDYVLRPGICTTPNATKLMQGYGII
jgi:DNA mismatch repair ATPase MutS